MLQSHSSNISFFKIISRNKEYTIFGTIKRALSTSTSRSMIVDIFLQVLGNNSENYTNEEYSLMIYGIECLYALLLIRCKSSARGYRFEENAGCLRCSKVIAIKNRTTISRRIHISNLLHVYVNIAL